MTWFTIALLFGLAAVCSGIESALTTIPAARLRHEAERRHNGPGSFHSRFDRRASLVVITLLVGLAAHGFAICLLMHSLAQTAGALTWGVAVSGYLVVQVFAVRVLPKSTFPHFPLSLLVGLSRPAVFLNRLLGPLFHLPRGWTRNLPSLPSRERAAFLELTDLVGADGTLTPEETGMIHQTLKFDRTPVSTLMLPLRKATTVSLDEPVSAVLALARETDLNQFPVSDGQGEFVGLVRVFELLKRGAGAENLRPFLRDLVRIPGSTNALQALQTLRLARTEIGLVTGLRGNARGLISSYDIVQALIAPESLPKRHKSR